MRRRVLLWDTGERKVTRFGTWHVHSFELITEEKQEFLTEFDTTELRELRNAIDDYLDHDGETKSYEIGD